MRTLPRAVVALLLFSLAPLSTWAQTDADGYLALNIAGTSSNSNSPYLEVSPSTLAFGNVQVGMPSSLHAKLTASTTDVTISSHQSSNSEFAIKGIPLPLTIAAGKSVEAIIEFTPSSLGTVVGKASFSSNISASPTVAQLSGTGVDAAEAPQLSITPTTLSFGNVNVGSSLTKQLTFTASNAAVTLTAHDLSNSDFMVTGMSVPLTIAAGKSVAVSIKFTPKAAGTISGKANFVSNVANSPTVVQLTGTSGSTQASAQLAISPTALSFGSVTVGSSATLPATLTASNAAVTISSDQSTSSEFTIHGLTLPATLAAGKSLAVTIQFSPTASGTASAKAGFISNAGNTPAVTQVTGTGVAQTSHSVDLSWDAATGSPVGYNVYRGAAEAGPFSQINSALNSSTTFTDSSVVAGATYYYVAAAINAKGQESAYSNVAQAVIP